VKRAMREVETSWTEMGARRQARFAHADSLAAIEQREAGGEALTPTFVNLKLQTQEELAEAARAETEAVANYNIAISRLELAKGTLLRYNNVIMEEANTQMAAR
jgi:outer membrane protein